MKPLLMQVKFQRGPMALYQDSIEIVEELAIERIGLLLGLGYTFTDFFAQGVSFKTAAWFIHLFLTGRGNRLCAGNIRVPLTRPSSLDDVCLLAPLFSNAKEKEALVQKFISAFRPDPAYVAEMERLETLQRVTNASFDDVYGVKRGTAPSPPPQTPMAAPTTTPIPPFVPVAPTTPAPIPMFKATVSNLHICFSSLFLSIHNHYSLV